MAALRPEAIYLYLDRPNRESNQKGKDLQTVKGNHLNDKTNSTR